MNCFGKGFAEHHYFQIWAVLLGISDGNILLARPPMTPNQPLQLTVEAVVLVMFSLAR
jgi:hypothetical protein